MASISAYMFGGSNIGPDGILNDGQNIPETLFAIQKKFFGSANILIDSSYFTKSFGGDFTKKQPNAFMRIQQNNLYSQVVPLSNPCVRLTNPSGSSYAINGNAISLDPSWSNYGYSNYAISMSNDNSSKKYISSNYPYIAYYSNLLLTAYINTNINSLYKNLETTYMHPLLQNTIPVTYDISYSVSLSSSNTGTLIPKRIPINDGSWLFDTDAGIITFNDYNASSDYQVSRSNPPRISFFRYEGLFGEANILEGQDL